MEATCNDTRGAERVRPAETQMESEVERRGKLLEFEAGAKTDGSGLSTLIWSPQRCLTFLCITSLCCHPTGLGGRLQDRINNMQEKRTGGTV